LEKFKGKNRTFKHPSLLRQTFSTSCTSTSLTHDAAADVHAHRLNL